LSRTIYLEAVVVVPWLLRDVEAALERSRDGDLVDAEFVRQHSTGRTPSREETAVALRGLRSIGILREAGTDLAIDREAFDATSGYRLGVWEVSGVPKRGIDEPPSLCVGLPPQIPKSTRDLISSKASDLRSGIVSVISAAHRRLVLASPFWDVKTAVDIGELVRRRAFAGAKIDVLARSASDRAMSTLVNVFADAPGVRLFKWYQARPASAAMTFHFKAVVADDGRRAYVGTANLTEGSLRSTMELGFIVGPEPGRQVAEILDAVIGISDLVYSSERLS
jgi:hypothetical protein